MTHSISTKLEAVFNTILTERMYDLPVINANLVVKAVGFHEWNGHQLGILITPWFMNLMLLPGKEASKASAGTDHKRLKVGGTENHIFPSGSYEFVTGFEEVFGYYQSCSLFSPMFEFDDQGIAELTAKEALDAIMDSENTDTESQNPIAEIEQIWSGEKVPPIAMTNFDGTMKNVPANGEQGSANSNKPQALSERFKEPTSRRDFLRGKAFKDDPLNPVNDQSRDT